MPPDTYIAMVAAIDGWPPNWTWPTRDNPDPELYTAAALLGFVPGGAVDPEMLVKRINRLLLRRHAELLTTVRALAGASES